MKFAMLGVALLAAITARGAVTATKSVVLDAPGVGVTYQIDVNNSGSSPVQAFVIDVVPATIVNLSATILSGGGTVSIDHLSGSTSWTGIVIPANGTASLRITGGVRSGAPAGTVVTNQATVQYDSDGNGSMDASTATNAASFTVPSRTIRAAIQKTQLTPAPVVAGSGPGNLVDRITITASASNERSAIFTVSDTPEPVAGFTLDSAVPSSGTWNQATREWTTDWILPGASATLDVTLTAAANAPSQVSNTGAIVSGSFEFIAPAPSAVTTTLEQSCVAPVITHAPAARYEIAPGGTRSLSVQATGTDLAYRWTFIYPISGMEGVEGTTPTVVVTPPYSRAYHVTVTNACGAEAADTYVCIQPRVSTPVYDDASQSLSVVIDPALSARDWPSLQWFDGADAIPGATTAVLTMDPGDQGTYWVRATNGCTTYDTAGVTVAASTAIPTLSDLFLLILAAGIAVLGVRAVVIR